jgi:tetratricopeptide (TPR) repeat protein
LLEVTEHQDRDRRLDQCDLVLQEDSHSVDPVAIGRVADALREKARLLCELNDHSGSLQLWEEVAERYTESPPSGEELIGLEAAHGRTRELDDLELTDDALAACEALLDRWDGGRAGADNLSEADELQRDSYLADALFLKLRLNAELGRIGDVLPVANLLIDRYGQSDNEFLRGVVARTLRWQVRGLLLVGDDDGASAACRALVGRFLAETDPQMQHQIADPLLRAARSLISNEETDSGVGKLLIALLAFLASLLGLLDHVSWPAAIWQPMRTRRRRWDEAARALTSLTGRLDGSDSRELQSILVAALQALSTAQVLSGKLSLGFSTDDAMYAMGEPAIRMLRGWADAALTADGHFAQIEASGALLGLGVAYATAGQPSAATAAYAECIENFRRARSPIVQAFVIVARACHRFGV